jgi:type IV secretory pathway VirB10-like protein
VQKRSGVRHLFAYFGIVLQPLAKINIVFGRGVVLTVCSPERKPIPMRMVHRVELVMKRRASFLLLATLLCSSGFAMQETSPSSPHGNPQDVPKQKPGTDNPDLGKGMRPTPDPHSTKNKDDVPEQKPGPNNPDLGKDKRSEKPDTSTNSEKSKAKRKRQGGSTSTSY